MGLFTLYQGNEETCNKSLSVETENVEGDALLQNMESQSTNSIVVEVHHGAVVTIDNRDFTVKVQ